MTAKTVIQIHDVSLKYNDFFAVKNLSWEFVGGGEIIGLLGNTGSGKSSLFSLLVGIKKPTRGEIFVLGYNSKDNALKIRNKIGYCPQNVVFDSELSVRENLECFALYQDVSLNNLASLITEIIHFLDLEKVQDELPGDLPYPLQKRLSLGFAFCHHPEILLLDEPFLNLDEKEKNWLSDLLLEIKHRYKAILISEQNPNNLNKVCDHIVMMSQGQIIEAGSVQHILDTQLGTEIVELFLGAKEHPYFIKKLQERGFNCESVRDKIVVHLRENQTYKDVIELAPTKDVIIKKPTVVDLYNKYLGEC